MVKYGVNRIVLMVRDTEWLFAYWEIGEEKRELIIKEIGSEEWGKSKLLLRLYDVTDIIFDGFNAHVYYDTQVNEYAANWYLGCPLPDKNYIVDLLLETEDKKYFVVARSNTIKVPKAEVSEPAPAESGDTNFEAIFRFSRGRDLPDTLSSLRRFKGVEEDQGVSVPKCWESKKMILCRYCTYRFMQKEKKSEAGMLNCWEFKSKYPSEISSPLSCTECDYYKSYGKKDIT